MKWFFSLLFFCFLISSSFASKLIILNIHSITRSEEGECKLTSFNGEVFEIPHFYLIENFVNNSVILKTHNFLDRDIKLESLENYQISIHTPRHYSVILPSSFKAFLIPEEEKTLLKHYEEEFHAILEGFKLYSGFINFDLKEDWKNITHYFITLINNSQFAFTKILSNYFIYNISSIVTDEENLKKDFIEGAKKPLHDFIECLMPPNDKLKLLYYLLGDYNFKKKKLSLKEILEHKLLIINNIIHNQEDIPQYFSMFKKASYLLTYALDSNDQTVLAEARELFKTCSEQFIDHDKELYDECQLRLLQIDYFWKEMTPEELIKIEEIISTILSHTNSNFVKKLSYYTLTTTYYHSYEFNPQNNHHLLLASKPLIDDFFKIIDKEDDLTKKMKKLQAKICSILYSNQEPSNN